MSKPPSGWIVDTGNSLAANLVFATPHESGLGQSDRSRHGASGTPLNSNWNALGTDEGGVDKRTDAFVVHLT
jgi:hypothetical protein